MSVRFHLNRLHYPRPHINFTFPTNGTTTPNFPNWQLNADTVTLTSNYRSEVTWDDLTGYRAEFDIHGERNVALERRLCVEDHFRDYTYDGTPVVMDATATLYDSSTKQPRQVH